MIIKIAICQIKIKTDKDINLKKAFQMIEEAAEAGSQIIVLPEIFNSPYDSSLFKSNAEFFGEKTTSMLSSAAEQFNIYIVGGSIPEKEINMNKEEVYFNTSFVFDPEGNLIGKHRKVHLFDINIKNKISFKESDVFKAGDKVTVFNTSFGLMGVIICYDMRFPEIVRKMALRGANIIFAPAAFNTTTGPVHWHLTARSRALDNQVFFVAASPAKDIKAKYIAYGHSLVCNPWGEIIAEAGEDETILYSEVDLGFIKKIREELPLLKHLRPEIYK